MKYDVFISYRRIGGKDKARSLKSELERRGYRVFLDFDDLKDSVFDARIMDAIDEAPIFLVLLSENSLDRCKYDDDWVRKEIEYANLKNKHLIPINPDKEFKGFPDDIPDNIREYLGQHQFSSIDFEQLFQESINKMVKDRIQPALSKKSSKKWIYIMLSIVVLVIAAFCFYTFNKTKILRTDRDEYLSIIKTADSLYNIKQYEKSVPLYKDAIKYEEKYMSTKYETNFDKHIQNKIDLVENKIEEERLAKESYTKDHKSNKKGSVAKKSEMTRTKESNAVVGDYEFVDLGLSVKWAKNNIGVVNGEKTKASDYYGEYFTGVNAGYDVAKSRWGNNWMTPTKEQMLELVNNCVWEWVNNYDGIKGLNGYKVRSKRKGYSDGYIFLPAAGYSDNSSSNKVGEYGLYWSSSSNNSKDNTAYNLEFFNPIYYVTDKTCDNQLPIRPVTR